MMSLPAIAGLKNYCNNNWISCTAIFCRLKKYKKKAFFYGTGMDTTGIFINFFKLTVKQLGKEFSVQPQASVLAPTPFVTEIQDCATSPDNFLIKLSFMINPGFQEESYIGGILRT